ncbi:MAG: YqaE/Pmp3 family membrane protein [Flavobacteriales bacterium]|nr:YqaE/Pmp3 family membrane protein [Flavobacteriales bacterium]
MKLFYKTCFLLLIISSFSCGTSKLTNYGRPLHFLSNQRVPRANTVFNQNEAPYYDAQKMMVAKKNNNVHHDKSIVKDLSFAETLVKEIDLSISETKSSFLKVKDSNFSKSNNKLGDNILSKKIENLISANKFSNQFNTSSFKTSSPIKTLNDDISDLVLLLICLLFPPVAVWWRYDFRDQFWYDLLLYAPMIILSSATWAFLPVLYAIYVCFLKKKGNSGDVRSSW